MFLAPVLQGRSRFGYVDDIAIYHSATRPLQASRYAADDASKCARWLEANEVPADPAKIEFLRVAKKAGRPDDPVTVWGHDSLAKTSPSVK